MNRHRSFSLTGPGIITIRILLDALLLAAPGTAGTSGCRGRARRQGLRGLYGQVNLDLRDWGQEKGNWEFVGSDLGLDARRLAVQGGRQGRYSLRLAYDALPSRSFADARSPFLGISASTRALPTQWIAASSTAGMRALSDTLKKYCDQARAGKPRRRPPETAPSGAWNKMSPFCPTRSIQESPSGPLPAASARAQVDTLRVDLNYRFEDRDNRSPTNNYDLVESDSFPAGERSRSPRLGARPRPFRPWKPGKSGHRCI